MHRYSDKHECPFDYQSHGQEEIRKANPQVVYETPEASVALKAVQVFLAGFEAWNRAVGMSGCAEPRLPRDSTVTAADTDCWQALKPGFHEMYGAVFCETVRAAFIAASDCQRVYIVDQPQQPQLSVNLDIEKFFRALRKLRRDLAELTSLRLAADFGYAPRVVAFCATRHFMRHGGRTPERAGEMIACLHTLPGSLRSCRLASNSSRARGHTGRGGPPVVLGQLSPPGRAVHAESVRVTGRVHSGQVVPPTIPAEDRRGSALGQDGEDNCRNCY
uniref:HTH araC/xylS-type domain-containing protein n=1 Tax=Macrostomum lignano TaxID=282301 RepID=A0A1I8I4B0_9PLAT